MENELSTLLPPDMYQDVGDFHRRIIGVLPPPSPTLNSPQFLIERFRFMQEELDEFLAAGFDGDMVKTADGLADLIYTALGTAYRMGLPMNSIWTAVHSANMRKVPAATSRMLTDAAKPHDWVGPEAEIAAAIREAIG